MRYKRVLLANPAYTRSRVRGVFSAGLGYIAQALSEKGLEYDVLDMSLGYSYGALKRKIKVFAPGLLGISMMSYGYKETYGLIDRIKEDFPGLAIVAGGPHVSLLREKVLKDCPGLDYGIVMEGEETFTRLCGEDEVGNIKGLLYRRSGEVVYNGDREFLKDLDSIAFPRYEKFELERYFNKQINALPVISSRGCPFECVYCPVSCSIGRVFRARSAENILDELKYWYGKGYRYFSFGDDNFTLVKERVRELCELIKESSLRGLMLSCDNGIRADKVDRELLTLMKEAGFYRLAIGVEAGNDRILKNLKKQETVARIEEAIKNACELCYEVDLFFLVGSPGETREDLEDSFRIASRYPIGAAYFYNIIPFPNTELFRWIEENGRFLAQPEDYLDRYPIFDNEPVFETAEMPLEARKKALKDAFAITRKTARRSWSRRMSGMGLLGRFLAFLYTSRLMQDVVLRNRSCKALAYRVSDAIIRKRR